MKTYKKLQVELDERLVAELKRLSKQKRVYLSVLVENYLIEGLKAEENNED